MPRQANRAVRQHLHPLVAAERLEITEIQLEAGILRRNDVGDLVAIRVPAIRGQAHHFTFIAIFQIADELADHRVEAAQGVRQENTLQHFNVVALAARHHGGDEVSRTVVTEARSLLPGRAVIGAGDVRDVMFQVMLLKLELLRVDLQSIGQ